MINKRRDKMKEATQKSTNEKRELPAKLVRDGANKKTANKKAGEDHRC